MSDQNQNRKADEEYSDTEGSDSGESYKSEEHRSRSGSRSSGGGYKILGNMDFFKRHIFKFDFWDNTPPGAKLGLCRSIIFSKLIKKF